MLKNHLLKDVLKFSPKDIFFIAFREIGREGNIHVREKHQLLSTLTHLDQGLNPQPRHVPCLGIKPTTFLLHDDAPTHCLG